MTNSHSITLHHARLLRGIPPAAVKALIRRFLALAEPATPGRWTQLDILFTGNAGIRPYKLASFGLDEVTDVITLTYAPAPGLPGWSGELIINAERALELGPRYGGAGRELALYLAHGIDHLTGGEDDTPPRRRRMRRRELGWLAKAAAEGLLKPLAPFGAAAP
jgi:ssRNA-specific RNase YbeY (16S rRNA maturation enzyme)